MRVPLGDAKTRLELLKAAPNIEVAREGFLEGRNHPDDVDGMISLFIDFSGISYIRKAINIWSDAQPMAEQMLTIARCLREEIRSPHPSQDRIDQLLASVYRSISGSPHLRMSFRSPWAKVPAGWKAWC